MVEMAPVVMQRSASQVSLLSDAEADAAETRDAQGETRQHGDAHARADDERNESDDSSETRKRKWYAVALLTLTSAFLYADQNLLSPNLSAVAEEFGLSDEEKDVYLGGYLQLAFFCVGAPASLVIGWLADKMNRVRLLAIVVAIGEGPCLGTYFVKTYWELFAVRSLTGIAVGGCLPLLFSICGDLFPSHERAYVATFLTVATGAGIAGGQIMAGTVGPAYGWRLPFVLSAAPAILLALVTYTTVKEPERGGMEHAVMQEKERKRRGGWEELGWRVVTQVKTSTWNQGRLVSRITLLVVSTLLAVSTPRTARLILIKHRTYEREHHGYETTLRTKQLCTRRRSTLKN